MPSPLAGPSESVRDAFAKFEPQGPLDLEGMFKAVPDFFESLAEAIKGHADRLDDLPVDKAVIERVRDYIPVLNGLRDSAGETLRLFQDKHEVELRRAHDPRPAETAWDVGR